MMKKQLIVSAIVLSAALLLPMGNIQAASVTVATFADPSGEATNPLFTVNWASSTVNGIWDDSKTNLDLQIVLPGAQAVFNDAWFVMDPVNITSTTIFGGEKFGTTGSGQIRFYENGTSVNPVMVIDFLTGFIGRQFISADEFYGNNVTITGSAIPYALSFEQFSFSFANVTALPGGVDGFTSTASFTSSAVPEPTTIALLGLGTLLLMRRKRS